MDCCWAYRLGGSRFHHLKKLSMKKKTKILIGIAVVVAVAAVAAWLVFGTKEGQQQQQNKTLNDEGGSAAPESQISQVSDEAEGAAQVKGVNY